MSNKQLIVQALNAAETNIRLAKQLLSAAPLDRAPTRPSSADRPGIVGTFEGTEMVTPKGERFKVNPNYASKSVLVYGDTLKKIDEDGRERFKQIERVKRETVEGVLVKKDGKFVAVTKVGSYRVLPEAVEFHGGKEGSEVVVVIPAENKKAPFAAIGSIKGEEEPSFALRRQSFGAPATKTMEGKEEKPKKSVVARVKEKIVKEVKPEQPEIEMVGDEEELR